MTTGINVNDRIAKLREQSLNTVPRLSIERARLVTEAYQKHAGKVSVPVLRALTFKHLMENKTICINEGELIVGERGTGPQETPTYPELCCHTVEDFDVIDKRDKIFFRVDEETKHIQKEEIIPFWRGKAIRDLMFAQMTPAWKDCYEAGIYTEFMEQRSPGHTVAGGNIYQNGFLDFKKKIEKRLQTLDFQQDPEAYDKQEELTAMAICCDAIITFAHRHAAMAKELAGKEESPVRKRELEEIAEICSHVPAYAPRTFREALQMYWFVHLGVITELNTWDSFCPGKLDIHLYPFYERETKAGTLTREAAKELLKCFWVKVNNQPAPPKVGITLQESATYTDFCNINIGGIKPDGTNGVNEVSYLLLDVVQEMRILQPSTNVQVSRKNPDQFVIRAAEVIREGMGFPSVFNTDAVLEELLRQGKSLEDARGGGTSGCVEVGCFGKEAYILTGYFNLVKILEITLHNGIDPQTGKKIGLETGDATQFGSLDELLAAFKQQVKHFADIKIRGNNVIERLYAKYMPAPFMSIIIEDCIENARDYNAGGARYNSRYIQGVGIGSITDCLSAINYHVYDNKNISMAELLAVLQADFEGHEKERQLFLNKTPKYGNDDDYADRIMLKVFEIFHEVVNGRKTPNGGTYRIEMLPTTCHVYFGAVIGAMPDGRKAGRPLSEGISPVQGADKHGPTAVIKSAAKMDQLRTGGALLNQKFTPQVVQGETGLRNLKDLIRAYFKMDGHHIQFNIVDAATLRDAQKSPEKYTNLIVRVAGYSDYFNNLTKALQDEIIERTEHAGF
ncbi:trans-4-hydroxy-L-proline dehydratase [Sporomusa acidovorans]|uniref:Trans-4-hydroxy-L-proline dehydratase n=1 Tax=Sporomusa acidovorans (strain ATCC 49682 / DSM 3132 / Mol) TaxID=1123286 RepID=A0ABZ3IXD4_SPOA4|nr:trans-4-hydroxy-L-proline dehydratase [Sporomusa acidovorans]OZC22336.1 benzylsuccinate synthase alpha subunit [Sporomusa acidovorans DSM 3132]SDE46135.1 formate C-acetyltransferase [Sporomusa acidovorans]